MNKWTKTAGLIFLAAASVYSDQAIAAKPAKPANSQTANKGNATDVKLLDETDPFAATGGPTTEPSAATTANPENKAPAAPVQINPDGTFSLNITAGADVVEQLRVIGFQAQESIIPSKEVHGVLPAMDLYNVTVHEALDAMLHANGFAWREKGKFIYVYSAKEIAEQEKASRVANTEVFRLYYTPAANAMVMIKPVLSGEAQVAVTTPAKSGITTGVSEVGGNEHSGEDLIVVTDFPENLDKVRQILKEVDRRPQQIIIEATILSATLNEDNALGIDFNVVGGVDFNTIIHNGVGQFLGAGQGGAGSLNTFSTPAHSVGTGNSFTNSINGGLKVGVVTNNVSVFIAALEGITDTTVLANPKVLALNKQKGEVIVGREDGYLTTTTTETSSTQTIEFLKTGTRLIFRPFIGDDGYVRMEIHPEDSSGGLQTSANLPFKVTTEVTSNVMVKDGHTIVIGGLFRESSNSTRSQIPGLGNLPLAGPLFRQKHDTTNREEVIILLTPHIVKDDSAYSQASEAALKDAERMRVGVRKGMMWTGRERLAQSHYEKAVEEMNKPNPNRGMALWHLDSATNLYPNFLEAIHMKEELTGKEVTTSDGSSIRSFVRKAMLVDNKTPATQASTNGSPATAGTAPGAGTDDLAFEDSEAERQQKPEQKQQPQQENVTDALAAGPATAPTSQPQNVAVEDVTNSVSDSAIAAAAPTTSPASKPALASQDQQKQDSADADDVVTGNAKATKTTVTELPTDEDVSSSSGQSGSLGAANK